MGCDSSSVSIYIVVGLRTNVSMTIFYMKQHGSFEKFVPSAACVVTYDLSIIFYHGCAYFVLLLSCVVLLPFFSFHSLRHEELTCNISLSCYPLITLCPCVQYPFLLNRDLLRHNLMIVRHHVILPVLVIILVSPSNDIFSDCTKAKESVQKSDYDTLTV